MLRLVEMVLDQSLCDWVAEPINGVATEGMWTTHLGGQNLLVRILVQAEDAEQLLEILQHCYGSLEEFRCVLLPVEATLPPCGPEAKPGTDSPGAAKRQDSRRSREDLHEDVQDQARLTAVFVVMAGLSAVGGLLAWLLGLVVEVPIDSEELKARTSVGLGDFGLALASGVAGALAFTSGLSTALVGVMVAVALMPPLAAMGLMAAAGAWPAAGAAGLLFLVNLACINFAGVTTFTIQGIRPPDYDEARNARLASVLLAVFGLVFLAGLMWVITHLRLLGIS